MIKRRNCIICISIIIYFLVNNLGFAQTSTSESIKPVWKSGSWWIVEVWQAPMARANHDTSWVKMNELKMELKKGNGEYLKKNAWTISMADVRPLSTNGLRPEIQKMMVYRYEAYYDDSFNLLNIRTFGKDNVVIFSPMTPEAYSENFFLIPTQTQNLKIKEGTITISSQEKMVKIVEIQNPKKYKPNEPGIQYWEKNKPWWSYYEVTGILRCTVTKWSNEGVK